MAAAQAAKDKGNAAFQKRDFELALANYSTAMQLDPSQFTYPLNRCMTYLKLERWREAEKDATLALKLEPANAKALFRRGLARKGLKKLELARQDFEEAKAAGAGPEVEKELASLPARPREQNLQSTAPVEPSSPPSSSRLRAAFTPPAPSPTSSSAELMKEVSTRRTPTSFAEKKQQRNGLKPSFQTLPSPPPAPAPEPAVAPVPAQPTPSVSSPPPLAPPSDLGSTRPAPEFTPHVARLPPPTTAASFELSWTTYTSPTSRLSLLKSLNPTTLPTVFKSGLTPDLLSGIVQVLSSGPASTDDEGATEWAIAFLRGLTRVQRFATLVGFLDDDEKLVLKGVFERARRELQAVERAWELGTD